MLDVSLKAASRSLKTIFIYRLQSLPPFNTRVMALLPFSKLLLNTIAFCVGLTF
jgi:hypothetical protein